MKKKAIREDRLFVFFNGLILLLLLLIILYPLYYVVIASISSPTKVAAGETLLAPRGVNFKAYMRVFKYNSLFRAYKNTIVYTVGGTVINLVLTFMTAYPLSRKDLWGRGFFSKFFCISLFFQGGIIPLYLVVRGLGLYDSAWALLLIPAISMWNVIITRTFLETTIPSEMQEAAQIDGCSNIRTLIQIVLPLSLPIVSVMAIFYGVQHWNSYFNALIYLSDDAKYPLQILLRQLLVNEEMNDMLAQATESTEAFTDQLLITTTMRYALMVISSLPIICIYPMVQKHFAKGVMVGTVKG